MTKYLKNLFARKRVIGDTTELQGLLKADALLNNLVNASKVPGLGITVLKDGMAVLQKGYGYEDLEHKTPIIPKETIFRIASVSKPIAATALAYIVLDGLIDLDASFYEYVPYYPKKQWDFTIRQLASHTAGVRGYQGTEYGLNKPYSIKESIEIFKDDDLLFEPGTDYLYNSFGWVLISLALQEASGIPFEEYVKEKVLKPLGLVNTFAECHPERSRRAWNTETASTALSLTIFYSKNRLGFRKAIPVNNFYKLAGGGYLSTTEDIAKFGQAYLDGKILNEEVLSPFLTSETINGNKTYYGLGWQVSKDKKGRNYYGHVGNGVGGYSNFFVYPKQRMVFAILINCTNPNVQEELDEVVDVLMSETSEEAFT
ncbi:beta-lactamase family protein [Maribacter algarum]|uniref:Beta-lactamase family protein n=1 Tax=Maribacter algarum (ex Zhang et al. 2020) TaxID=2578118 RepID=A0A5S3QGF3_9FLAO|nr:beta-lactamase family protein [Maribacter algarum]